MFLKSQSVQTTHLPKNITGISLHDKLLHRKFMQQWWNLHRWWKQQRQSQAPDTGQTFQANATSLIGNAGLALVLGVFLLGWFSCRRWPPGWKLAKLENAVEKKDGSDWELDADPIRSMYGMHSLKVTWPLKMMVSSRIFFFRGAQFSGC